MSTSHLIQSESQTSDGNMCAGRSVVSLALIVTLFSSVRLRILKTEASVSCVYMKSCLLPCSFRRVAIIGPSLIYWTRISPKFTPVYAYSFRTQTSSDGSNVNPFDNRAHLFFNQLLQGNSSLLLTQIQTQDQGTYRCLIKYGQKPFKSTLVHVDVQAPVRDVLLEEDGERLKCVSRDIFPKPSVSWSPQSNHSTSVTPSGTGLFSVLSSVPLTQRPLEEYSCNVSTGTSWRSATYRRNPAVYASHSEVTLLCDTNSSLTGHSRVWKFNRTETIVTQTGNRTVYSEAWRRFVAGVSEFGSLTLTGLRTEHRGLFSCELTTDIKTLNIRTTRLEDNVQSSSPSDFSVLDPAVLVGVGAAVGVILAAGLTAGICICRHKKVQVAARQKTEIELDKTKEVPPESSGLLG